LEAEEFLGGGFKESELAWRRQWLSESHDI
jgi:hypothetical protein